MSNKPIAEGIGLIAHRKNEIEVQAYVAKYRHIAGINAYARDGTQSNPGSVLNNHLRDY